MQTGMIGQWLKARRDQMDLTRAQVANQIGCAVVTLEKIERNQRRPSKQMAGLLAVALRIPDEFREQFVRFARGEGEPPAMDASDPPVQSAPARPLTNLPASLTSFVDRANEMEVIRGKLMHTDVRLFTLIGPPGIGKTRLAIQAAGMLLNRFAGGVWFIDLAPLSDPKLVPYAIARVFGIVETGTTPLITRLQDHLRFMEALLVLDNFEQVIEAAPVVAQLLKACAMLKVVATSREPLRVYGEHVYAMPGLSLPPHGQRHSVEQMAEFEAIKLFFARAEAVRPGFMLNAHNAHIASDICTQLDGMPLAIELAVAQMRRCSPDELHNTLKEGLLWSLTGTDRDVEPRQRTLRNAIQWSYDLLSASESAVFSRLGVFAGGFTTEAALAVCELSDDAILHALADQSLIRRDANGRWSMAETVREFALETLSHDPLKAQTKQLHAEHYANLISDEDERDDEAGLLRLVNVEEHNARIALRWLIDGQHARAVGLVRAMAWYWLMIGSPSEGLSWLLEVLASPIPLDPVFRAHLYMQVADVHWYRHEFPIALEYAQSGLAMYREAGVLAGTFSAQTRIGRIQIEMGDYESAKDNVLQAIHDSRSINASDVLALSLVHLGEVELSLGDAQQAEPCFEEAYSMCHAQGWQVELCLALACIGLGEIAMSRREYARAHDLLIEGLRSTTLMRARLLGLDVLAGLIGSMPRRKTADIQRAAKIWGASEALRERMDLQMAPGNRRRVQACIVEATSRLTPEKFRSAWAQGRDLTFDEALALAQE